MDWFTLALLALGRETGVAANLTVALGVDKLFCGVFTRDTFGLVRARRASGAGVMSIGSGRIGI